MLEKLYINGCHALVNLKHLLNADWKAGDVYLFEFLPILLFITLILVALFPNKFFASLSITSSSLLFVTILVLIYGACL